VEDVVCTDCGTESAEASPPFNAVSIGGVFGAPVPPREELLAAGLSARNGGGWNDERMVC